MDSFENAIERAEVDASQYASLWQEYYDYISQRQPQSTPAKLAAFASACLFLIKGVSWTAPNHPQGPTIRAYAAELATAGPEGSLKTIEFDNGYRTLAMQRDGRLPEAGRWTREDAYEWCEHFCFCDIREEEQLFKLIWLINFHFDNDVDDRRVMLELTGIDAEKQAPPLDAVVGHVGVIYDEVDDRYYNAINKPLA